MIDYSEMGDSELNLLVAEKVMEWKITPDATFPYFDGDGQPQITVNAFASSVAAAFTVVEKLRERVCLVLRTVHDQSENKWCVEFWGLHSKRYEHHGLKAYAPTLPRAISIAALKSVEEKA